MPSTLVDASWVDIRTPPQREAAGLITGWSGAVLEVSNLARAQRFYHELLGIGSEVIQLVERAEPRVLPDSGTHHALRWPRPELGAVLRRLAEAGVVVEACHEDSPSEREQNRYCTDPDGNRIQLVAGDTVGLDHAAIETHDLEWAEVFYTHVLGGTVEMRVGWHMDDFAAALAWGDGQDDCAPGTRRLDKRYTSIEHKGQLPRPNAQVFVTFAPGVTLGIYLATEHRQEPPPDQFEGTPRLVLEGDIRAIEDRLRTVRLRCMQASPETGGPFERRDGSLFVRDPGGNFLELRTAQ